MNQLQADRQRYENILFVLGGVGVGFEAKAVHIQGLAQPPTDISSPCSLISTRKILPWGCDHFSMET